MNLMATHERCRFYLPLLLCFSIPISTALTTGCMVLLLAMWLLGGDLKNKILLFWEHPLAPYLLALIALCLLRGLFSFGSTEHVMERFRDVFRLSLIPILGYYLTSQRQIYYGFYAFIAAMLVTLVAAFLKVYLNLPIGQKFTEAAVFKTHIDTNFFMSLAAFYVFFLACHIRKYRLQLCLLGCVMLYYIFFMSIGRIGYVTMFLVGLYAAQHYCGKKGLGVALLLLIVLGLGIYQFSDIFQQRIDALEQDWAYYQQGQLLYPSLGSRLQFYQSSLQLLAQKPVLGWGTGSFGAAYEHLSQGQYLFTDNPHNEYLRTGVESGLFGMFLLILLFIRQWQFYGEIKESWQVLARGTLLLFASGCLLNSWMTDFAESYFYVVFTALSLSMLTTWRPGDLVRVPTH